MPLNFLSGLWTRITKTPSARRLNLGKSLFDLHALGKAPRDHNEALIRGLCTNAYLGDHISVCRVLGRYSMFVDTRDIGFSTHMLLSGYWEMWVTEAFVARVKPGMRVVDCGANLGYFTLIMADLVGPHGHVDAFEPNPAIAGQLVKTIDVNGYLGRTTVHQAALSHSRGEAVLQVPPSEPKNAYMSPVPARPEDIAVTIPTMRLDEMADAGSIDLIKIDVEGAEEQVWAGMRGILASGRPLTVILEFAAARYTDPGRFLDDILSHGFSSELIDYVAGVIPTTRAEILARPAHVDQMLVFSR